jgi:hypothetical protein
MDFGSTISVVRALTNVALRMQLDNVSLADAALISVTPRTGDEPHQEKVENAREVQVKLLQTLTAANIDAQLFDLMLSRELDRNLKQRFGVAFFSATIFFTLMSYGVIIGNGIGKWGISNGAITALIAETPIQFIGLLYIIARNLFPQTGASGIGYTPPAVMTPKAPIEPPRPAQPQATAAEAG